ncbi:metal ABC transporter permease [Candidatus Babeliales bacterium]|nr:metal ABC transporter permease [Candidatus Babeliales bacterium]
MIFYDPTILFIIMTIGMLGICSGILGSFLFLQRKSLLADTIAHATLPGITGFCLATHTKNCWFLIFAGTASAIIATYVIHFIKQKTLLKNDTIFGIVLSTALGLGTIFLSKIQKIADAHQTGLCKYLIGNTTTLLFQDFYQICIVTTAVFFLIIFFFRHLQIMLFDPENSILQQRIYVILYHCITLLTTITIVIGLQAVGIILISALLIIPACIAKLWCTSLQSFITTTTIIGLFCTSTGTIVSSKIDHVPTGPAIIAIAAILLCISLCYHYHQRNFE